MSNQMHGTQLKIRNEPRSASTVWGIDTNAWIGICLCTANDKDHKTNGRSGIHQNSNDISPLIHCPHTNRPKSHTSWYRSDLSRTCSWQLSYLATIVYFLSPNWHIMHGIPATPTAAAAWTLAAAWGVRPTWCKKLQHVSMLHGRKNFHIRMWSIDNGQWTAGRK